MQKRTMAAMAMVAALAGSATAQPLTGKKLIAGFDDTPANVTTIWAYDFDTSTWSPLVQGLQAWGLAADDANGYLYVASTANSLWRIPYGTLVPENLGTFTSSVGGGTVNFVSLAYSSASKMLYGTRNISTTNAPEGLYEIDPATRVSTLLYAYNTAYDFGGLDYNPADGELYGTNDATNAAAGITPGLFKLELNGTITQVAAATTFVGDGGATKDVDGLAIGDGKAYLIVDQPGETGVYDFGTSSYLTPLTNPFPTSEIFGAGAFVNAGGSSACESDFNGDTFVDDADFVVFAAAYDAFTIPPADPVADLNGDGFVDDADFVEFAAAYEAFACP